MPLLIEWLGLLAGTFVCASTMPQIVKNIKDKRASASVSIARQSLMTIGNMLWVGYGVLTSSLALIAMCTISVVLNLVVLIQAYTAQKQPIAPQPEQRPGNTK